MQETRVRSLGWEDPLEKEIATTPGSLLGKSHGQRSLVLCSPWGCKESDMTEQLTHTLRVCIPLVVPLLLQSMASSILFTERKETISGSASV